MSSIDRSIDRSVTKEMEEDSPNITLKRKPVSLRRKSFGGQTGVGIFWRKRAVPNNVLAEEDNEVKPANRERDGPNDASHDIVDSNTVDRGNSMKSKTTVKKSTLLPLVDSAEDVRVIGWDDDLCRPIYNHRAVSSDDSAMLSDEDNANDEAIDEDFVGASCHDSTIEGSIQDEESAGTRSVVDAKTEANDNLESANDEVSSEVLFHIPPLARKRTRTFGNRGKRPRPLSLILRQEDLDVKSDDGVTTRFDPESRRISLESSGATPSNGDDIPDRAAHDKDPEFDTNSGDAPTLRAHDKLSSYASAGKKRKSKKQRAAEDSLEKARDYFANLDQTQRLILDATSSPTVSSRVTRTSRRTNLNSPGINRAYRAYAESIRGCGESGLSPLSIRDYAASRRIHFENKGEIVDGFLDD